MLDLAPGERFYLGYHEWAVHPDEASVILGRGYVVINGVRYGARQVDVVGGRYPQIKVDGIQGDPSDPRCPGLEPAALSQAA